MNFSTQIITALQEKLDLGLAFPVIFTLRQDMVSVFAENAVKKLHSKIEDAMGEGNGERFVDGNDALGLALHLIRCGVALPPVMLMDICEDIIDKSRRTAQWICPIEGQEGDLWYCKLYIDLAKDETR